MNYKYHIGIGIPFTIFVMLMINIFIAIAQDRFARDIFVVYYDFTSIIFWSITIPVMFLYNILPDIDHHKSMTKLLAYSFGAFLVIFGLISNKIIELSHIDNQGIIIYGIVVILATLFFSAYTKHRGPTHTIQFAFISTMLLYLAGIEQLIYYTIAFISVWMHLWLDKVPFKVSFKPSNGHW